MTKFQRIRNIVLGVIMILTALLLILYPQFGYYTMLIILSVGLLLRGIRSLVYYFSMARHMVGGFSTFIIGVITLDLALFTMTVTNIPQRYIMIYLLLYYIFSGVVDILRAFEARKLESPRWFLKIIKGVVTIGIAIVGIIFSGQLWVVVTVYSIGLVYSGVSRIITAFRKNDLIFIQ